MNNQKLKKIIEEFKKSEINSEAEVRSKFIVPLIEYLGYPSELRAEEFPVYGREGSKPIRTKNADFLLFMSKEFAHNNKRTEKHKKWVEDNSLLVFEAKNKGEMPEDVDQPVYYTIWSRAIAYLISDGEFIKGYYYKEHTSDIVIINCRVESLPDNDIIEFFSYENILSIKKSYINENRNSIRGVLKDVAENDNSGDGEKISTDEDFELPAASIEYMRRAYGRDSIGLDKKELVNKFLNFTNLLLKFQKRFEIPEYMIDFPREFYDVIMYRDNDLFPVEEASAMYFYCNEEEKYLFRNEDFELTVQKKNDKIDYIVLDYRVQYSDVNMRLEAISKLRKLLYANSIELHIKGNRSSFLSFSPSSFVLYDKIIEQINIDYDSLKKMKAIEEYYGIKLKISNNGLLNVNELLENITTIYCGIMMITNGSMILPKKIFKDLNGKTIEITKPEFISLLTDEAKDNIPDIRLFNYLFSPEIISIMPCSVNINIHSDAPISMDCCCTYKINER